MSKGGRVVVLLTLFQLTAGFAQTEDSVKVDSTSAAQEDRWWADAYSVGAHRFLDEMEQAAGNGLKEIEQYYIEQLRRSLDDSSTQQLNLIKQANLDPEQRKTLIGALMDEYRRQVDELEQTGLFGKYHVSFTAVDLHDRPDAELAFHNAVDMREKWKNHGRFKAAAIAGGAVWANEIYKSLRVSPAGAALEASGEAATQGWIKRILTFPLRRFREFKSSFRMPPAKELCKTTLKGAAKGVGTAIAVNFLVDACLSGAPSFLETITAPANPFTTDAKALSTAFLDDVRRLIESDRNAGPDHPDFLRYQHCLDPTTEPGDKICELPYTIPDVLLVEAMTIRTREKMEGLTFEGMVPAEVP